MERDKAIDTELLNLGWTVFRFWGQEILNNTAQCVEAIEDFIFQIETGQAGFPY